MSQVHARARTTDDRQNRAVEQLARRREAEFLASVRALLRGEGTGPSNRFVVRRLLEMARIYESIWDNSARIHYNAGRQDFGHQLLALVTEADGEMYLQMEIEARVRAKRDADELAASRTRPAGQVDTSDEETAS